MTRKLFHPLQEVCCIAEECTAIDPKLQGLPDVYYGKTYKIRTYERFKYGVWWVSLVGFSEGLIYSEDSFVPMVSIKEVIEIFNYETV